MFLLLITSCVGNRQAHPIDVVQVGDFDKTCQALELELDFLVSDLKLLIPHTAKKWKFVSLSTMAGLYEFPWMYLADGTIEQQEAKALTSRYSRLVEIATSKSCDFEVVALPETAN